MSKKRYVDAIEDMDDSTYELLGSRVSKLATGGNGKSRYRERHAGEREAQAPKTKRSRDRHP